MKLPEVSSNEWLNKRNLAIYQIEKTTTANSSINEKVNSTIRRRNLRRTISGEVVKFHVCNDLPSSTRLLHNLIRMVELFFRCFNPIVVEVVATAPKNAKT